MTNRWIYALVVIATVLAAPAGRPAADRRSDQQTAAAQSGAPKSDFVLPVLGAARILTPFQPPAATWGAGHRGVDLAADAGSAIRAAGAGTVAFAGTLVGRGVVSVQHRGTLRTTYEPVDASVAAGDEVTAGQVLGTLHAGHPSCLPVACLHWGARIGPDRYLDPMMLILGWQVRLLPWDSG